MQKRPTLDKFIAGDNITLTPDNDKATLKISAQNDGMTKNEKESLKAVLNITNANAQSISAINNNFEANVCNNIQRHLDISGDDYIGINKNIDSNDTTYKLSLDTNELLNNNKLLKDKALMPDELENLSMHIKRTNIVSNIESDASLAKSLVKNTDDAVKALQDKSITKDKIGEGLTIKDDKLCSKLLTKDTALTQDERMSFDQRVMRTDIVGKLNADINILKEFKLRLENPDVFYLQAEVSFLSGYKNAQVICTDKNKNILSKLDFYTIQVIPTKRYDGVLSAYVIKDDNDVTIHVNRTITGDILDVRLNIIAYSNV